MKGLTFVLILALMASATAQAADPEPLYTYDATFTIWSNVTSGVFWNAVRNERTDASMISWTTGADYPVGTIPGQWVEPEAAFPLRPVEPTLPRAWFNAFLASTANPVVVLSTMRWSDGSAAVFPVYLPADAPLLALQAVPEPSGLLALAVGLIGLAGAWKRRRH